MVWSQTASRLEDTRAVGLGRGGARLGEATKLGGLVACEAPERGQLGWHGCTDCLLLGLISLLGNSGIRDINYHRCRRHLVGITT